MIPVEGSYYIVKNEPRGVWRHDNEFMMIPLKPWFTGTLYYRDMKIPMVVGEAAILREASPAEIMRVLL